MENLNQLIRELIAYPNETEWLEFKRDNYTPDMIAKDICALANSAALSGRNTAYMLWGIEDQEHRIVGTSETLPSLKKGNQELENWLRSLLSKNADFEFDEIIIDQKRVGVLTIRKAEGFPVAFEKVSFIRVGSYTKRLD